MKLKLKRTPGIYLVGFMASGKSTIGRRLAEELGWGFVDLDEDIEADAGITIREIFESLGEEPFRQLETEALRKRVHAIQAGHPMVIALGGGAFARSVNFDLVSNNGISIWLDCPLSIMRRRVEQSTHRPLARDLTKFETLYEARRESYARADYRIEIVGDDSAAAVAEVLKLPLF